MPNLTIDTCDLCGQPSELFHNEALGLALCETCDAAADQDSLFWVRVAAHAATGVMVTIAKYDREQDWSRFGDEAEATMRLHFGTPLWKYEASQASVGAQPHPRSVIRADLYMQAAELAGWMARRKLTGWDPEDIGRWLIRTLGVPRHREGTVAIIVTGHRPWTTIEAAQAGDPPVPAFICDICGAGHDDGIDAGHHRSTHE